MKNLLIVFVLFLFSCKAQTIQLPAKDTIQKTLWGTSLQNIWGETKATTFEKINAAFKPEVVRVFYSETETDNIVWPDWLPKSKSAFISFKLNPADVINKKNDDILYKFFNSLPDNKVTWWCYYHEPEDEIEKGILNGEQYKEAFNYIIKFKNNLKKNNAVSTSILMTSTLKPETNRNWKDYIPSLVECIAWDGYHRGWDYINGDEIFAGARQIAKETGKPWGVAEVGVNAYNFTKGTGFAGPMDIERRKKLLSDISADLANKEPKPAFVCYFNSNVKAEKEDRFNWIIWDNPALSNAWMQNIK